MKSGKSEKVTSGDKTGRQEAKISFRRHFHEQKVVRKQEIAGIFNYFCVGLRQLYPKHVKIRGVMSSSCV